MRRPILLILLFLILVAGAAFWWWTRPLPVLTVVTWPGTYGRAQAAAQMQPYGTKSRTDVRIAQWERRHQRVATGGAKQPIQGRRHRRMELPVAKLRPGEEGLLEPLDVAALPPGDDGSMARDDFIPGAIGPCWVASIAYTQMIVDRPGPDWAAMAPTGVADFFDLKKYPGPRALVRGNPKFILELALLADGVAPKEVYRTLGSEAGLARAFARLDALKGHVVWLDSATGAIESLREGRANFALANNSDVAASGAKGFGPGVIGAGQMVEFDVFGIPRRDPKKERAWDYIRYATGTQPLAAVADWVPYSPARRSAWPLVGQNPLTHEPMHGPLNAGALDTALAVDDEWWRQHGPALQARFRAWADAP